MEFGDKSELQMVLDCLGAELSRLKLAEFIADVEERSADRAMLMADAGISPGLRAGIERVERNLALARHLLAAQREWQRDVASQFKGKA